MSKKVYYCSEHEEYPCFELNEKPYCPWDDKLEFTEEEFAEYTRVMREYRRWQARLKDLVEWD